MAIEKHKKAYNQFNPYLNATTGLSLKRFFAYSIAVHTLILVAAMLFMPTVKEKKMGGEFFTRLISPEEFLAQVPSIPEVRSAPHAPPRAITPAPLTEGKLPDVPEPEAPPSQLTPPPASPTPLPSIREKIFDRSIIGDLAKREIEKEEKGKKEGTFTFDTKGYQFLIYNMRLKEKIERIWIYPPDALARGIYGDLIIKFSIKKNGRLGAVELIRTSGHKSLDDAAIKALRDAEPFWPLPAEWGMEAYSIEGRFLYTIYGYYIR